MALSTLLLLAALSPPVSRVGLQTDFSGACPPELLLGGNASGASAEAPSSQQLLLMQLQPGAEGKVTPSPSPL